MHRHKILVADDDSEWRRLLDLWLRPAGYRLFFATCGKDALIQADTHHPDCILLDFELGDKTALEVCQTLHEKPWLDELPIIILTSHSQEKLHAYKNCQADNFVVKDGGNPDELLAVLNAVLRRVDKERRILERGDIRLEPEGYRVYLDGRLSARLSREQFIFLYVLIRRSPDVVPHEEIFKLVLHEYFPDSDTEAIRSLVSRLRAASGRPLARRIKNIRGVGWLYQEPRAKASPQPESVQSAKI